MAYFKIGANDYSMYTNALNIETNVKYNAQINAAGNTVVDYVNQKRIIEVGIIPLNDNVMSQLQTDIAAFSVPLSFLNPKTKQLETNVNCIIPSNKVEYYTIQVDRVMYKALKLSFEEL